MTPPSGADITVRHQDAVAIVRVAGEVDVFNADEVGAAFTSAIAPGTHGLVADLTELEFLDSTAIRRLFVVSGTLTAQRMQLRVVVTEGGAVQRTLGLVGFMQAAPVVTDLHAAVAELSA